jgi:hypothetical protein
MKFIVSIALMAILAAVCQWMSPWWSIVVVAFIVSLIVGMKGGQSFLMGFLGISLFWLTVILIKDAQNEHILGHRMAQVFGGAPYPIFIAINVLLGGLVGGLSAWSAALIRAKKS